MAEKAYANGTTLDVAKFLQGLKFTRFHLWILILSCLVTFFDGLDFALIAYTLPYIRDEMHLTDAMTGYVSSAAFLGQMIGSLVGSYVADVIGRRPVILICTVLSAVLTFVTGFAQTPEMLMALRFVGGLTIGGLLAPAWSLNIEAMPAGKRATAVTIIMLGFSVGASAAGPITNFVAPSLGWHYVFFTCGGLTLALAVALQFMLPESARWLVAQRKPRARIMPLLNRFDPGTDLSRYTAFELSDERNVAKEAGEPFRLRIKRMKILIPADSANPIVRGLATFLKAMSELFHGWLAWITPLIWATYFCSSFAIYLKSSYGVLFLEILGVERLNAAWISSAGGIAGAVAGVLLLALTEKRGPGWITLAPLVAIPFTLLVGLGIVLDGPLFIPVIFIGMIAVGAGHAAVISITSIYYPSSIRAMGGGWASFMAKFAAVAAPILGGYYFLSDQNAVLLGYVATATALAGIVVGVLAVAHFARKLGDEQEREEAAAQGERAATA